MATTSIAQQAGERVRINAPHLPTLHGREGVVEGWPYTNVVRVGIDHPLNPERTPRIAVNLRPEEVERIERVAQPAIDFNERGNAEWQQAQFSLSASIVDDGDADTSWLDEPYNAESLAAYERGELVFVGLLVSASKYGVPLGQTSLWGIAVDTTAPDETRAYLETCARELADEAVDEARKTAGLLCAAFAAVA